MKTSMKLISILTIMTVAISAQARTKAKVQVPTLESVQQMTSEVKKLDYKKEADRFRGQMKVLEEVKALQAFSGISAKAANRMAIFKSLMEMVRQSEPYDGEGQLADVLTDMIRRDSSLRKAYNQFVKALPNQKNRAEFCKTENFKKVMKEQLCLQGLGFTGQDITGPNAKKGDKCIEHFDFDACLKGR